MEESKSVFEDLDGHDPSAPRPAPSQLLASTVRMLSTPQMRRDASAFAAAVQAHCRSKERTSRRADNPHVYMDFAVGSGLAGRIVMELRKDVAPQTAENFRRLCTGEQGISASGNRLHYAGNKVLRVWEDRLFQAGDLDSADGGESCFGKYFADENFELKHSRAGILSMASSGPNTNGSQFFLTFGRCRELDGSHTVFGEIESGFDTLDLIEAVAEPTGEPRLPVMIVGSGQC